MGPSPQTVGVVFTIVGGAGASALALLCWRQLRGSLLRVPMGLLCCSIALATVYHALLLFVAPDRPLVDLLQVVTYVGFAATLSLFVVIRRRLRRHARAAAALPTR